MLLAEREFVAGEWAAGGVDGDWGTGASGGAYVLGDPEWAWDGAVGERVCV